ncbi:hypothetical protein [Sandarakinorhabdus sp. AAP62]|uniref:hypothetical protein n=1 Tax=Sandarakinorhabdus sp. AAP62 TaxID=1248916 RepID=UPI00187C4464|nr:hypothetical protein [Sandarakinorhabdus sp. AAP62]
MLKSVYYFSAFVAPIAAASLRVIIIIGSGLFPEYANQSAQNQRKADQYHIR